MNIKYVIKLSFLTMLFVLVGIHSSYADIFDEITLRAKNLGFGLKQSGYLIAGLGLIAFSVAAIFNKISWKTLAYIMVSCFLLTFLTAVVEYTQSSVQEVVIDEYNPNA